jgi:hypothetical protein
LMVDERMHTRLFIIPAACFVPLLQIRVAFGLDVGRCLGVVGWDRGFDFAPRPTRPVPAGPEPNPKPNKKLTIPYFRSPGRRTPIASLSSCLDMVRSLSSSEWRATYSVKKFRSCLSSIPHLFFEKQWEGSGGLSSPHF